MKAYKIEMFQLFNMFQLLILRVKILIATLVIKFNGWFMSGMINTVVSLPKDVDVIYKRIFNRSISHRVFIGDKYRFH